jgi:hypothetical protein
MAVHTLAPLADALQFLAEQTELASIVQAILQPAAAPRWPPMPADYL